MWQLKTSAFGRSLDVGEGVLEVTDHIVGVFDADGKPECAIGYAQALPLIRSDAAVGRDGRVQHLAPEVAERRRGGRDLDLSKAQTGAQNRSNHLSAFAGD